MLPRREVLRFTQDAEVKKHDPRVSTVGYAPVVGTTPCHL